MWVTVGRRLSAVMARVRAVAARSRQTARPAELAEAARAVSPHKMARPIAPVIALPRTAVAGIFSPVIRPDDAA